MSCLPLNGERAIVPPVTLIAMEQWPADYADYADYGGALLRDERRAA
jgi:hypothetical protein